MKIRLSSQKPYESTWMVVLRSVLAFLLAIVAGMLALFQPEQAWTFVLIAILSLLICGYSLVTATVNKGLFDCVILTETEVVCKRAFRKTRRFSYDSLDIRIGAVDGQASYLFFSKGEKPTKAELSDVKYPDIKDSERFFAAYSELGEAFFEKYGIPVIKE